LLELGAFGCSENGDIFLVHAENEQCDQLATTAAWQADLPVEEDYDLLTPV
jgi:hypothetical protein